MTTIAITAATATTAANSPALFAWQRYAPHRQRHPRWIVDHQGSGLVHLACKGGAVAVLDADDFDALMGRGVTTQWHLHGDGHGLFYVRAKMGGNLLMVSRLILDTPRGKVIRYADHNPLNLRRDNLVFGDGFSKQREKAAPPAPMAGTAGDDASEGYIF